MTAEQDDNFLVRKIKSIGIWSINPYRGCAHRCVYCVARHQGDAVPWFPKEEVISELRLRLTQVSRDTELFVGSLVDAYPAEEGQLKITRIILKELSEQRRPFCIGTKSSLVCRDIDILQDHPVHCDVYLSLCSLQNDVLQSLEPGAPSVLERLNALSRLAEAGVDVNIDAAPWIPGISNAEELIRKTPKNGKIQFAPLDTLVFGGTMKLMGTKYVQEEINKAYLAERQRIGDLPGVWWKDPPARNTPHIGDVQ